MNPKIPETPKFSKHEGHMHVKAASRSVSFHGKGRRVVSVVCFNDRGDYVGAVQAFTSPAGRKLSVRLLGTVHLED